MSYPQPPINYTPIQVPNHITKSNYVAYTIYNCKTI